MSMNSTVEIKWSEMEWLWVVAWSVLFHEQIKFKCELNSRSYANNAHVNFEDTQQKWIRYCCTEAMNLDVYLWNTYHVYTSIAWTMDCSFSLSLSASLSYSHNLFTDIFNAKSIRCQKLLILLLFSFCQFWKVNDFLNQ